MTSRLKPLPKTPVRALKDIAYYLRDKGARVYGQPSSGMLTDFRKDGKRVVFIHNPKTGGSSLGGYLGVKRRTHAFPSDRFSSINWQNCFSIVAIRDPFDRFLSGYFDHVGRSNDNALTRIYGPSFKSIDPYQYLDIILANPKFGGSQLNWTHFPCAIKPRADIILRFEEIALWEQQIADVGLIINSPKMAHRNAGSRGQIDSKDALSMTNKEYSELKRVVRKAFHADALSFGYALS